MKSTLIIAPFPGAHLRAEDNRGAVASDFATRGASIAIWFGISLSLGIAGMGAWTQLVAAEAAFKCAAGV